MKKRYFLTKVTIIVIVIFAMSGCYGAYNREIQSDQPTEFIDGLGRQISLNLPIERIISLAPSNTELLFAVGAGSQVVGVDEFSDFPAEVLSLTKIGGSFGEYNLEKIVELKPDLVFASELNPPELVQSLEDLGITVFYLTNPTDFSGLYENIVTVGKLTGYHKEAEELVDGLTARVEDVRQKVAGIKSKPLVFYEIDSSNPDAPFTAGKGTFVSMLIELAGGANIGDVMESPWGQISIEELLVQDPDIILLGDSAYGVTVDMVSTRAGWEGLSAVVGGKVYEFDDNLVSRPGPRLVAGLEAMLELFSK